MTSKQQFGYVGFQVKFDTSAVKPTKTEPSFRKLNSSPTKLGILFLVHLQVRELSPQTYSLSFRLEWSQVTHIPTSIKAAQKWAFYNTLPDIFVITPIFQDDSLSSQHTHNHPSLFQQALHIQQVRNLCIFLKWFLQSSAQPHESAARPLQRAPRHIKVTHLLPYSLMVIQPHWLESAWYTTQGCPFSDLHTRSCYHWTLVYATWVECPFYISQFPADVNCTIFRSVIYRYLTAKAEVWSNFNWCNNLFITDTFLYQYHTYACMTVDMLVPYTLTKWF